MDLKRGQISLEYLIVVGFITFLVISLLSVAFLYTGEIKDKIRFNQVDGFANKIISSAETVFYAGEPSRVQITTYLPEGVKEVKISDRELIFNVTTSSGVNVISFPSNVNLTGAITNTEGTKKILIIAQINNVLIS